MALIIGNDHWCRTLSNNVWFQGRVNHLYLMSWILRIYVISCTLGRCVRGFLYCLFQCDLILLGGADLCNKYWY